MRGRGTVNVCPHSCGKAEIIRKRKSPPGNCQVGFFVVRLGGFEPPTFGTGIQRSIQLSYKRMGS